MNLKEQIREIVEHGPVERKLPIRGRSNDENCRLG